MENRKSSSNVEKDQAEVAVRRCSFGIGVLKNGKHSQENTCVGVSF